MKADLEQTSNQVCYFPTLCIADWTSVNVAPYSTP